MRFGSGVREVAGSKPKIRLVVAVAARAAGSRDWLLLKLRHANGPHSRVAFPAGVVLRFTRQLEAVRAELALQRGETAAIDGHGPEDDVNRPVVVRSDWHGAFFGAPFVRAYNNIAVMIVGDTESSAEEAFMLTVPVIDQLLHELRRSAGELVGIDEA